ncbi:MAG: hypothetical protein ACJ8DC_15225 [Gemmatimonadales bacterium]
MTPRNRAPVVVGAVWLAQLRALLRLPLSLLPTFLVPLIIASHVVLAIRLAGRPAASA